MPLLAKNVANAGVTRAERHRSANGHGRDFLTAYQDKFFMSHAEGSLDPARYNNNAARRSASYK